MPSPNFTTIAQGMSSVSDIINEKNPVSAVENFLKLMKPAHDAYAKQWFLNISYLIGNQWIVFNNVSGRFIVPRAPTWRVRLVVNKVLPIARTLIAKLRDVTPRVAVASSTSENEDMAAARLSTKVAQSIFDGQDVLDTRNELALWQVACGNAYTVALYDEKAGKQITELMKDEAGQPIMGPDGAPVTQKFNTGDLLIDFASPFEIIPDFSTSSWKEQHAVVRRKVRSIDFIKRKYGKEVNAEDIGEQLIHEQRIMNMATTTGRNTSRRASTEKSAIVKEMWVMPSDDFPDGRRIITANGVELFSQDRLLTKRHGKHALPVTHFGGIEIPGRLLDMSPLENLIELQNHYNRGRSQIIENINMLGRPKVFAPIGSIPDGAFTDEPGEIVEYDSNVGPPPVPVTPPAIPNYHLDNLTRLTQEMEDVAGVHEISLGRLPRRATSGVALSILEEKDTTIITPMRQSLADGLARTLSLALGIAQDKFKERRISKIVGKDNAVETFAWLGADLKGQDDVRVKIDQPFPQSRAAKLEFAIQLVRSGILPPEKALKILELDDLGDLSEFVNQHDEEAHAKSENMGLLKGQNVEVGKLENHDLHIRIHKALAARMGVPEEAQEAIERHIEEHRLMKQIISQPPLTEQVPPGTLPAGGQSGNLPPL